MRLLIADDSATFRKRLLETVSQIPGVEIVRAAEDGTEALAAARSLLPDVAILDIQMPGVNGLEVLREIRQDLNGMVVIMLTNHADKQYEEKSLELGADYFFLKSAGPTELYRLIDGLVNGKEKKSETFMKIIIDSDA